MSAANIRRQLEIVSGLFGYRYGPGDLHEWVLNQLSAVLSYYVADIRDLGIERSTVRCCKTPGYSDEYGEGPPSDCIDLPTSYYINKKTGKRLTGIARVAGIGYMISSGGAVSAGAQCQYRSNCPSDLPLCFSGSAQTGVYMRPGDVESKGILFETIGHYEPDGNLSNVVIYVKWTDDGVPYFLAYRKPRKSQNQVFKEFLSMAVVAASFVIPGLGPTLASSVFGSFAAAYPAVANAIVNVAMQTALNGGDVESAVERVAAGALGAQAGTFINGVSDSAALGRLTSVATSAAVRGESIQDAVSGAALSLAPALASDVSSAVQNFVSQPDAISVDIPSEGAAVSIFDIPTQAPTQYVDYDFDLADIEAMGAGQVFTPAVVPASGALGVPDFAPTLDASAGYSLDDFLASDLVTFDQQTGVPVSAPPAVQAVIDATPIEAPATSFFENVTFENVVDKVTDLAIGAIRIHQAYQAANRPPVQPVQQTTRAGGVQTARPDGTLTTTDPATGRPVVTRPPAGVPYEVPGGGLMMNNGDGTYTVVSASGQSVTRAYTSTVPPSGVAVVQPAQWVSGVPNAAILGGGALFAALLLMNRR